MPSKPRPTVSADSIDFRYFVALTFKVRGARLLMCVWKAWRKRGGIIHQQCALHITEEHKEPSPRPRQISHMLVAKVSTFHQKMLKVRYPNSETFIKQESLQYIPKE